MKTLRFAIGLITVVLLGAGYAASQWAAWTGQAAQWSAQVVVEPVQRLALVLGLAILAFAFFPESESEVAAEAAK